MRLVLTLALVSVSSSLYASTIYDNGLPITNPASDCSSLCPDLVTSTGIGVFTLQANSVLMGVQFWTFESPGSYNGGTLNWGIYSDNSGVAGPLIGSGTFTLSENMLGTVSVAGYTTDEFATNFVVNSLPINPPSSPQNYFLEVFDHSPQDTFGIFWATSGQDTLSFQLLGTGNNVIEAQAPEPGAWWLVGSGLVCVALLRRRSAAIR